MTTTSTGKTQPMGQQTPTQRLAQAWPAGAPLATTAQLMDAGLGDRTIASALKHGHVFRLRKGAYVQAQTWRALKPWEQDRLRLLAHLVTVRGTPTYSHFSAARLHGLFIWRCGPQVHVSARSSASGTSTPTDVVGHHEALAVGDVRSMRLRNGQLVHVTTLERTVVDCARIGGFAEAVIIGDHALRKGARSEVMWAMVNDMVGRRGVRKARRVLRALDGRSESPGESRTRLIIAGMDIPQPELQVELLVEGRVYRPDFVWTEQRLIVEFDGDYKYFDFKPTAEVILAERKREKRLMEAGWRFVRLEWKDLSNPEEVRRRILAVFSAQRGSLAA
ncbi:type IV toxin-antitoxin system AbiEi family antitoxin domain-containing protein [Arthrobacter alpinus]|uniref:type IV toxin-antitoxin system AbiEi family antitoxin domain-containing protein n=1 Tax=Arthrobacter alpinus TaxID=656366 RepID=UPI00164910DA|nr:type IV toxin-antitoxin system AbiEi family antitoxin domain-containing protein [Arthrobacter alpinus]